MNDELVLQLGMPTTMAYTLWIYNIINLSSGHLEVVSDYYLTDQLHIFWSLTPIFLFLRLKVKISLWTVQTTGWFFDLVWLFGAWMGSKTSLSDCRFHFLLRVRLACRFVVSKIFFLIKIYILAILAQQLVENPKSTVLAQQENQFWLLSIQNHHFKIQFPIC